MQIKRVEYESVIPLVKEKAFQYYSESNKKQCPNRRLLL
jgi:hypothetical protein